MIDNEKEISVTATKNKRGRPKGTIAQAVESDKGLWTHTERTEINTFFAGQCVFLNEKEFKPFFVTDYGGFRRNGIAEQIGRMREEELATDEELIELTRQCIKDYENGEKVKDIEKRLRYLRMVWKEALTEQ